MTTGAVPYIVEAQRFRGSVIVTFSDDRCGVYPSEMLYGLLPQVEQTDLYGTNSEQTPADPEH